MKKFWFILPFFLLTVAASFAQTESTTPDGRKVLLYPDGTWKPVKAESPATIRPVSVPHIELPKPNAKDQIIHHAAYTLAYNKTYHVADWVAYELTAEETIAVVERSNHFVPDPSLTCCTISNNDYKGSRLRPRSSCASGGYVLFLPDNG